MRNVLPVPESSLAAADLDCRQNVGNWDELMIEPAAGPSDATMADDVEQHVGGTLGFADRTSTRLAMQGRGFQRVREEPALLPVQLHDPRPEDLQAAVRQAEA